MVIRMAGRFSKEGNMVFVIRRLGPQGDVVTRKSGLALQERDVLSPRFATFVNGRLCHSFDEVLEAAQLPPESQAVVPQVPNQEREVMVEMLHPIAGG